MTIQQRQSRVYASLALHASQWYSEAAASVLFAQAALCRPRCVHPRSPPALLLSTCCPAACLCWNWRPPAAIFSTGSSPATPPHGLTGPIESRALVSKL